MRKWLLIGRPQWSYLNAPSTLVKMLQVLAQGNGLGHREMCQWSRKVVQKGPLLLATGNTIKEYFCPLPLLFECPSGYSILAQLKCCSSSAMSNSSHSPEHLCGNGGHHCGWESGSVLVKEPGSDRAQGRAMSDVTANTGPQVGNQHFQ